MGGNLPKGRGSACWISVTTAGDVIQLSALSEQQYELLSVLQFVMAHHAGTAPLSGCDLESYRAARDWPEPTGGLTAGMCLLYVVGWCWGNAVKAGKQWAAHIAQGSFV